MAWKPMKPETIARRTEEGVERRTQRRAAVTAEMVAKAARENDPKGFWTEMLAERRHMLGEHQK